MDIKTKTVKFDPGYAPLVLDDFGQIGYLYYSFNTIYDRNVKKLNFLGIYNKIQVYLKTNVAFYMGCLLWASYIKQFDDCEIEGNQLLGETATEEEYTSEISFLIDVVKRLLVRDCKFYLKKKYVADERYLPILETYKQFLILNEGFVNCAKVSQIKLPENLKKLSKEELEQVNKNVQKAIEEKDIAQLLDSYNLLF